MNIDKKLPSTVISRLSFATLQRYLQNRSWTRKNSKREGLTIFYTELPNPTEILLPISRNFSDYDELILKAILKIAFVENREAERVINDLLAPPSDVIKRMDVKSFRELGYLQELNRQFLHPLGLALEVVIDDDTGNESFGGVWNYREDPEGISYGIGQSDLDRVLRFADKAQYVESERQRIAISRNKLFGFGIEPVTKK